MKHEKLVLTKGDVADMYGTAQQLRKLLHALVILILSRLGLREAELVGQRKEDAYCRCALCDILKRDTKTGILNTRIAPGAAESIRTWAKDPKGRPRGIKFKQDSYSIRIKGLDCPPDMRIPFPPDLEGPLRSYVAVAHFRDPLPGLRVRDFDFDRSKATIYGKGYGSSRSPERTLDVETGVLLRIKEYIDAHNLKPDDRIVSLSTRRIREIVKEAAFLAHLPTAKRVSPHRLRAYYITNLAATATELGESGPAAVKIAQENAGHADSSTTMIYIGVTPERKREVVMRSHQREKKDLSGASKNE